MPNKRILILVPDRLTESLRKGSFIDRYYNPGDLFDEVHLVLTNRDAPSLKDLQRTVGRARLFLYNLPVSRIWGALCPWVLQGSLSRVFEIVEDLKPQLMRCYGNDLNAYFARRISKKFRIPYIVSLHTNPDVDGSGGLKRILRRLYYAVSTHWRRQNLKEARLVLPVYKSILPYLKRLDVEQVEVVYNVLNDEFINPKMNYELKDRLRVVWVGRQIPGKDPTLLVRAVMDSPSVELWLFGSGPLQAGLVNEVKRRGASDRIRFLGDHPNDEVVSRLHEFDLFVSDSNYWELSKSLMEALFVGLPCVAKFDPRYPVPELSESICYFVDGSTEGYQRAFQILGKNAELRRRLGEKSRARAQEGWNPQTTEGRYAEIQKGLAQI